nr:venom serine protease-like [Halyomorpha halys]
MVLAEAFGEQCMFSKYIPVSLSSLSILSPGYPSKYPPSSMCYYYFTTDPGNWLTMDCNNVEMGSLMFQLTVQVEIFGTECKFSKYISLESGSQPVLSPGYPGLYPPSSECSYHYYTDPDYRLSMDCYDVKMESDPTLCSNDKLKFYSSVYDDNIELCNPVHVRSTGHHLLMTFTSTHRSRGGRFSCFVTAIDRESCDCGNHYERGKEMIRITGGEEAGIYEFPFMVSIVNTKLDTHLCGGSIISSRFVLTAAHCLQVLDVDYTSLLVGTHYMYGTYDMGNTSEETNGTRLHRASQFFSHPDFNSITYWNDIGLIQSATIFKFSKKVGPVCLPFNRPTLPADEEILTAMGWGTTSFGGPTSEVLLKVILPVVSINRCVAAFNNTASSGKQVCTFAPEKDTCQMDSGGPLIVIDSNTARMFQAAIVSFGGYCGGDEPAVNTKVASYVDWIKETTNGIFILYLDKQ